MGGWGVRGPVPRGARGGGSRRAGAAPPAAQRPAVDRSATKPQELLYRSLGATLQELRSNFTKLGEGAAGVRKWSRGAEGGGDLVRHVVARAELDDDAAEEGVGAEVPHRGPARAVVQQELGRHHDERLGEWAVDLATQRVEVVGGGRAVDDTKVVPGGTRRVRLVREEGRDVSS